jgi:hypothetical protein
MRNLHMFDHLVRDGVILFLIGVTVLNKICPFLKQSRVSDTLPTFLVAGWLATVTGFISMIAGVMVNSW